MPDEMRRAAEYFDRGAIDEAEDLCRKAIRDVPGHLGGHVLLGRILQVKGHVDAAQDEFQLAVKADPTLVDAWLYWAKLLQAYGHPQKAEACLRLALYYVPNAFPIQNDLAIILLALGKVAEAERHLERALEIYPQSEVALCNLGIVLQHQGRVAEAIAAYRRAIAINPSRPEPHSNLGDVLKERDLKAAEGCFEMALILRPDYPEALDSLGVIYFLNGRLENALDKFDRALAISPEFHRALAHKTTTLFMLGHLKDAWKNYRHRFVVAGTKVPPHERFPIPAWNGEPLVGKSLLIWTELGLGEEILQASMFHDALAVASRLTVECSPRLLTLFQRSFPGALFIPRTNPARASTVPVEADYQIAGGDLGAAFRNDIDAFPRHAGYLVPDVKRVEALRKKYRKTPEDLVVGISWASKKSIFNTTKTLALSELSPIFQQPGIVFVNLQYDSSPDEIAEIQSSLGVEIVCDETVDLSGDVDVAAAQVAAMDLIISVSNTAVHIAGALNVPVWNIIPSFNASGLWHWFYESDESPWYPSMKIYRRKNQENRDLTERIATDLKTFRESNLRDREYQGFPDSM